MGLQFYKPTLEEQARYNEYYRRCLHLDAVSAFISLFGYVENSHIERAFAHEFYWNRGIIDDEFRYLSPLGEWAIDNWDEVLTDLFPEGITFSFVPEILMKTWERQLAGKLQIVEDRNAWDYVCKTEELIHLEGSAYKGLRANIRKFEQSNDFKYARITPGDLPELIAFQERWYEMNVELGKADDALLKENEYMMIIFDYWTRLTDLFGGLIRIDGQIQAYAVSEVLDTYMISANALKGNYDYRGIYQAMDYYFTKDALSEYPFINLWNDGGYEGLRQTKLKMNPIRYVRKYDVTWNPKGTLLV